MLRAFFLACSLALFCVVVFPFGQGLAQSTSPCAGQSDILGGRKDILNPAKPESPEACDTTRVPVDLNPNTAQLLSILKQTGSDLGDLSAAWQAVASEPRTRAAAAQRYKVVEQDYKEKAQRLEREAAERKTSTGRLSTLNQTLEKESKAIADFEKNITAFQSRIDQFKLKDADGNQLRVFSDEAKVVETFSPEKFKVAVDQLNKLLGRATGQGTQ